MVVFFTFVYNFKMLSAISDHSNVDCKKILVVDMYSFDFWLKLKEQEFKNFVGIAQL